MTPKEARKKLDDLSVELSDESFFRYLKAGNREVVKLFLDIGMSPDVTDDENNAGAIVAIQAGQKDIARLLLERGASPEPLLNRTAPNKDGWDKLTASSSVLTFISSLLIAAVGGYFTYSYNQRQIALNETQSKHDSDTKEQANRVLELEAIQKLIPVLTSKDENQKTAALIAIQDLAHPDLAAHLAVLFKGQGSVQYLQQAAQSGSPKTKQTAVQALWNIATNGPGVDSQLASKALSQILNLTKGSVVRITNPDPDGSSTASGVFVTTTGYILTTSHITMGLASASRLLVGTEYGREFPATVINTNPSLGLAILKVDGTKFNPVQFSTENLAMGSQVLAIGYPEGLATEQFFSSTVVSIDNQKVLFDMPVFHGVIGGPLLDNSGGIIGLVAAGSGEFSTAIRGTVALSYLRSFGL